MELLFIFIILIQYTNVATAVCRCGIHPNQPNPIEKRLQNRTKYICAFTAKYRWKNSTKISSAFATYFSEWAQRKIQIQEYTLAKDQEP